MGIISIEIEYCNINIITDKDQHISVGVSNGQICCEDFGVRMYVEKKENKKEIGDWEVGRKDKNIYVFGDTCICKHKCDCKSCTHSCEYKLLNILIGKTIKDIIPIKERDREGVQFTMCVDDEELLPELTYTVEAYVNHNGYYPHEFYIEYPKYEKDGTVKMYSTEGEMDKKPVSMDELVEKLETMENLSESY